MQEATSLPRLGGNVFRTALVLLVCATGLIRAQPSLVAHWSFDEVSGTTAQDSAGSFNGTLSGGATFVTGGIAGNALSLDGASSSFVNMGASLPGFTSGNFSLVAWVKTTTTASSSSPVSKHESGSFNGYMFILNSSDGYGTANKAFFYDSTSPGGEPISTTTVNDGSWHQLAGVFTAGGSVLLYVDGILEATRASQPIGGNSAPFVVGGYNISGTPTGAFAGLVDDVQLYSSALSGGEVQLLFAHPGQTTAIPEPGAAGLWLATGMGVFALLRARRNRGTS